MGHREAPTRGCPLFQFSHNNQRLRDHAFYKRLGLKQSHTGFKLGL
jgi:hypothetical protein